MGAAPGQPPVLITVSAAAGGAGTPRAQEWSWDGTGRRWAPVEGANPPVPTSRALLAAAGPCTAMPAHPCDLLLVDAVPGAAGAGEWRTSTGLRWETAERRGPVALDPLSAAMATDSAGRTLLVEATPGGLPRAFVLAGDGWTEVSGDRAPRSLVGLVADPVAGRILAVGGARRGDAAEVEEWTQRGWRRLTP